ncbi:MAG TPA: DUF4337 domain-containing protein [Gemmatimonadaceae bacterium]|nr:DUF4337 domain-containing protein [Gemmatimonadaceae bacterium]
MPESSEVDLDKIRETIDEELEREGGALLRLVALTTAVFAAIAAIASLLAGSTVNEALVLKSESTQLQAQASDQWAYYQAKGIKAAIASSTIDVPASSRRSAEDSARALVARYAREQDDIARRARELERERDARSHDADALLAKHHLFAYSVAVLQVAIALGAVAALTRRRLVWLFSASLGIVGVAFLGAALFHG